MSDYCDFKYTCTPWYAYIIIVMLMLLSTLVATIFMYYQNNATAASQISVSGMISSCACNCISFLICMGLLALLCPTRPGRLVLWIIVLCSISSLICNGIALYGTFKGVDILNQFINRLNTEFPQLNLGQTSPYPIDVDSDAAVAETVEFENELSFSY